MANATRLIAVAPVSRVPATPAPAEVAGIITTAITDRLEDDLRGDEPRRLGDVQQTRTRSPSSSTEKTIMLRPLTLLILVGSACLNGCESHPCSNQPVEWEKSPIRTPPVQPGPGRPVPVQVGPGRSGPSQLGPGRYVPHELWQRDEFGLPIMPRAHRAWENEVLKTMPPRHRRQIENADRLMERTRELLRQSDY